MAKQTRSASAISWALAIEALAYSQEVDVDTLIDTYNSSPKLTCDVGSNAREMVSFRILERLFDPDTRRSKSVGRKSGVSFDFSKRCEDVLAHILKETPDPNTWNESEISKWHVQPFIAYKRSCLPKPSLQRLKDALLEGTPTFLKSFHQLVTSLHLNQHGTKSHEVNGASIFLNGASMNNDNETYLHSNQRGTKTSDVNDATFTKEKEKESPGTNDNVCQSTSNEGNTRGEDGDYVEQNSEPQPSNDHELYKKELNDILAKKEEFFSSIFNDRERVTQSEKASRCMKCKKGGELLVCSSDNCSFVFHNSCLSSKSSFDYEPTGKFYCPFCRYSQALSDYCAAEKKTSLARNNLVSFNRSPSNHIPKTSFNESKIPNAVSDPDSTILIAESPEKENNVNCVITLRKRTKPPNGVSNLELNEEISESSDGKGCNEENNKEVYVDRSVRPRKPTKPPNEVSSPDLINKRSESTGGNGCSEGTTKENDYLDPEVRLQEQTKPPNGVSNPDLIGERSESSGGNGFSAGTNKENAYADRTVRLRERTKPPNGVTNLKLYDESSESGDGKGCREGSNKEENSVGHTVRPRKRTLSSPSLQVPQRRRVPVPWTQSEEETLKKWVAKFRSDSNILGRGFPWSKILDLGASKFQSSRTPVDLKDKWRNMQKASKKSK